jgi:SAM-dependent methyltransferase
VDPSYAQRYRDLATRHWWWRARNDSVREVASRLLRGRQDAAILDIGCGDGVLFPFFSQFGDVEGIEPDAGVVSEESPWRSRIQIRPFDEAFSPGRRFDLIVMLDVLEHLEEPGRALGLVRDLLQDDGRLLVTVPAFQLLWTHHDELNRHFRRYTKHALSSVAQNAGLQVLESWYAFQWLFFAKLVERVRERLTGPSPPEEVPGDGLNDALYRVCRAERRLTGRIMPFGSSLLAVLARRRAEAR